MALKISMSFWLPVLKCHILYIARLFTIIITMDIEERAKYDCPSLLVCRFAVTVWYYDQEERRRAVKKFKGKQKHKALA